MPFQMDKVGEMAMWGGNMCSQDVPRGLREGKDRHRPTWTPASGKDHFQHIKEKKNKTDFRITILR